MAVKTITIDMAAYEILEAEKRDGESFSKVIKRKLGHSHTATDLLRNLDRVALEESTLDALDDVVHARSAHRVKVLRVDRAQS